MPSTPEPVLSILIATRDRAAMLARLLRSVDVARTQGTVGTEVVVVDNGSRDATATLLDAWSGAGDARVRLWLDQPGKSRALNRAIAVARAPLLAFADDDVQVAPTWVQRIVTFFANHPHYDAAMGRVLVPPDVTDPDLVARARRYGTVPLFDAGDAVHDLRELYGCNLVLRRGLLDRVGGFDERLGPGASGWGEDTDLCERALRAGLRLGYMPEVIVYHAIDAARLTPQFFRSYHRRKAQGDFEKDPRRVGRKNLGRLIDASLRFAWCSLVGDADRRMQARMRMIRHAELLRLRLRRL
jgi:GT2 family glycosyltransferase